MSKRSAQRRRQEHRLERQEREGEKRLDQMEIKALDAVQEIVERKVGQDESRQPRFSSPTSIFSSIMRWAMVGMANEPGARATQRQWDTWYRDFAKQEPFLESVLNGAVQIDQNRGWTLTGGKNQVKQFTDKLHAFDKWIKVGGKVVKGSEGGWRSHVSWKAQSYYTTGMGFVAEVGRVGRLGPLFTCWGVDPCALELTGNPEKPLRYYPKTGGTQEWTPDAFVRGKSLVQTDETRLGYGFPAVARCYMLAKIMVGVLSHYAQKTGIKTPDGILTGKFISEEQWDTAVKARAEALQADPNSYLNSLATIMSSGGDMPEFALTLLSSLPDRWDIDLWTKILMRGYELAFGYKGEFSYENAGVLGRGNEVEIQHRNATAQGGKDFALTDQEQLQSLLPPTLEFQYEERDVEGDSQEAALQLAQAQIITEVTKWVVNGQSVLTPERVLQLAAEKKVIPEDWTPQQEDVTATDEESVDTESERVYRACQAFPDEPIVRYQWPSNKTRVLYRYGADRFAPKFIIRFNPYHEPAGSPAGGQFAEGEGSNGDRDKKDVGWVDSPVGKVKRSPVSYPNKSGEYYVKHSVNSDYTENLSQDDLNDLRKFGLFSEDLIADEGASEIDFVRGKDGKIEAFIQHNGAELWSSESKGLGSGTSILNDMKNRYEYLHLNHITDINSAKYWVAQGFTLKKGRIGGWDGDWYREDDIAK